MASSVRRRKDWSNATGSSIANNNNKKSALSAAYAELGKELTSGKLRSIGSYTLGRPIGEGTYGKVRLGTHRLTGTSVAIKQVPKAHCANLTREIHHHRRLHHPNVMQLFEVLATESSIWMVTELCAGGELYDYLVEREVMPEAEARRIFGQLCLAVAYIHDRGIVHRDLKLENVLLDERCNVKLGDFGFTREFEGKNLMETFCGTTGYAAPEMLAGRRYTGEKVDIWSLGIILYALVCGTLPFDDDDEAVMKGKILQGDYDLPEHLSEECCGLITRILQQDPSVRPTIKDILVHPWFTKSMAPFPMETVDEDDGDLTYASADQHAKTDAKSRSQDNLKPNEHSHCASSSGVSETSFYSAKSKSDSESSDLRSSHTETTAPTTDEADSEHDNKGVRESLVNEPLSLKHRNESQSTITRQASSGSDGSRKNGLSSKTVSSTLPTHVEAFREASSSDESLGPLMPTAVTLEKRGSQSSSRSLPYHRTPSRTKRRSSSGLSDHHPPSLEYKPVDYASLLERSTPAIFSTVLEQNMLHQLSGMGMDVGQIVHSVVNEACDASGAIWWILKIKAEERARLDAETGSSTQPSNLYNAVQVPPQRSRQNSTSSLSARNSPSLATYDILKPTAMRPTESAPATAAYQSLENPLTTSTSPQSCNAAGETSDAKTMQISEDSRGLGLTVLPNRPSTFSRPEQQRHRTNSFSARLSHVLAGKDKEVRRDGGNEASIMIGNEHFAFEDRSRSPVGALFAKKGSAGSTPSSTPKAEAKEKKRGATPLREEIDTKGEETDPSLRITESPTPSPRKSNTKTSSLGHVSQSKSVETFSTISSSGDGDSEDVLSTGRRQRSSFLSTVRTWLGSDDKSPSRKKKVAKAKRSPGAPPPSGTLGRSGSYRRRAPSSYNNNAPVRMPSRPAPTSSLSRHGSSGSTHFGTLQQRPVSIRRQSAGSITPTTAQGVDEIFFNTRGSRPSSAQSHHRTGKHSTLGLHAKSGSSGSTSSHVRTQTYNGGGYSGSLRGLHARRPSTDGGATVRRHRQYPHSRSESGSLSRPSTPNKGGSHEDTSVEAATPRRSLDASSAQTTPRASIFVAHRSRTPYRPPSASPIVHRHEPSEEGHYDVASPSFGRHHTHNPAPIYGTWRRSWGKPPPSWSGPVDEPLTDMKDSSKPASSTGKEKLRNVFANRESDDDWEDEEEEITYAGGLGQLASSSWVQENTGPSKMNNTRSSPVLGSMEAFVRCDPPSSSTGRYAAMRSLFQPPSLGQETSPRGWIPSGPSDDGKREGLASTSESSTTLKETNTPSNSRLRSTTPAFKGPNTITEEEEDE